MKPNAFIDPKAFGHFVIMLPYIPNRPRTFCAKRFSVLSQMIFQSAENDFQVCRHLFYGLCRTVRPAPPPTNRFSPEKVRFLQTSSVPTF